MMNNAETDTDASMESLSYEDIGLILSGKAEKLESGENGAVIREIVDTLARAESVLAERDTRVKSQGRVSFGRPNGDIQGRGILITEDQDIQVTDEFTMSLRGAADRLTDADAEDGERVIHTLFSELGDLDGVRYRERSTGSDGRLHYGTDVNAFTGTALFHPDPDACDREEQGGDQNE